MTKQQAVEANEPVKLCFTEGALKPPFSNEVSFQELKLTAWKNHLALHVDEAGVISTRIPLAKAEAAQQFLTQTKR